MRRLLRHVTPKPLRKALRLSWTQLQRCRVALTRDTTSGEFAIASRYLPKHAGVVIDVGANDGISDSQSFPYIARGYRAILIEPHPRAFATLQRRYHANPNVTLLNIACSNRRARLPLFEGTGGSTGTSTISTDNNEWLNQVRSDVAIPVEVYPLRDVASEHRVPFDFDLLAIDAEHMDFEVLQGLDLSIYRPRIIISEESGFGKDIQKHQFLTVHGYDLISTINCNTIWKRL